MPGPPFQASAGCLPAAAFPPCAPSGSHPSLRIQCLVVYQLADEDFLWPTLDVDKQEPGWRIRRLEHWALSVENRFGGENIEEVKYPTGEWIFSAFMRTMFSRDADRHSIWTRRK